MNVSHLVELLTANPDTIYIYPEMKDAIECLRAEGIKTALLTNNYLRSPSATYCPIDKSLFDVVNRKQSSLTCLIIESITKLSHLLTILGSRILCR